MQPNQIHRTCKRRPQPVNRGDAAVSTPIVLAFAAFRYSVPTSVGQKATTGAEAAKTVANVTQSIAYDQQNSETLSIVAISDEVGERRAIVLAEVRCQQPAIALSPDRNTIYVTAPEAGARRHTRCRACQKACGR
jgi:hypothetical protein